MLDEPNLVVRWRMTVGPVWALMRTGLGRVRLGMTSSRLKGRVYEGGDLDRDDL